jgi:glutathione synthase/RimK-type ligase-like ATP-grasp enzyme
MILIITHKSDFTADFVVNELNERKINYRRFNCEDILKSDLSISFSPLFKYNLFGIDNYKAVWFRRTKLPEVEGLSKNEQIYILNEIQSLMNNLFSILSAKWLSSPESIYAAENKLLQLKTAQRLGFNIPETLITTNKDALKEFFEKNNGDIILKPISQTRIPSDDDAAFIFTSRVSRTNIERLETLDLTPCIFQKNIAKDYEIRVTVVGEKVFAAAVDSQSDEETKDDWRRKPLEFRNIKLPTNISDLCVRLLKELNLGFGAIDLIKTPDNEYIFLEINPSGQWVWVENQTGHKISEAIIEYLTCE